MVIDINSISEIDAFGYGTLAVINGWLELNEKDVFLACNDCSTKGRITSLGIGRLIRAYEGDSNTFDFMPDSNIP